MFWSSGCVELRLCYTVLEIGWCKTSAMHEKATIEKKRDDIMRTIAFLAVIYFDNCVDTCSQFVFC